MKKLCLLIIICTSFTACNLFGSEEEEDTYVQQFPFITHVPVSMNTDGTGTYTVTNGMFYTVFVEDSYAVAYRLAVIREDGTKGESIQRSPGQLQIESGFVTYEIIIGSPVSFSGLTAPERDEIVKEIQEQLDDMKHLYKALEVTYVVD